VVPLSFQLAYNGDRDDYFVLFKAIEGGGVGKQDACI
jgi:hypothetical protein